MPPFFTVYSPEGEAPAKATHKTHRAAMHQAGRLARANPGHRFYVMRVCSRPITTEPDAADGQDEAEEARVQRLGDDMAGEV